MGLALAYNNCISIHALLAESDLPYGYDYYRIGRFLSTLSLRRATARTTAAPPVHQAFLSTLSLRRATCIRTQTALPVPISIHALLAESDETTPPRPVTRPRFLSTLSLRRATLTAGPPCQYFLFLSTLSLRRATRPDQHRDAPPKFLSTLSLRRATPRRIHTGPARGIFLSTLSLRRATHYRGMRRN